MPNLEIEELIGRFSGRNLSLYEVKSFVFEPGAKINQPLLAYPVFVFPIRGRGRLSFDENLHVMDVSAIFHLYGADICDRKITCEVEGPEPLEVLCLYYRWDRPVEHEKILYQWNFVLRLGTSMKLRVLLENLRREWRHTTPLSELNRKAIFACILAELFSCANDLEIRSDESRVHSICDYLQKNISDKITVSLLCERYKISQNHLFYLFSRTIGISPMDYLITCRINRATALLRDTDFSVQDICYFVGYTDPHYFSRHFKLRTGKSPSQIRREFKNCPPNK